MGSLNNDFMKSLTKFNTEGDMLYKEGINEGAWWTFEWFTSHKHDLELSYCYVMNEKYDKLKKQNEILREALEKIAYNEYLLYTQGKTDTEHQYKMGITDGHRLAANWANEALDKAKESKS